MLPHFSDFLALSNGFFQHILVLSTLSIFGDSIALYHEEVGLLEVQPYLFRHRLW